MDREDIIKLAREAQLVYGSDEKPLNSVIRFAELVAAHEREVCAKVCEDYEHADPLGVSMECASAIRAKI